MCARARGRVRVLRMYGCVHARIYVCSHACIHDRVCESVHMCTAVEQVCMYTGVSCIPRLQARQKATRVDSCDPRLLLCTRYFHQVVLDDEDDEDPSLSQNDEEADGPV